MLQVNAQIEFIPHKGNPKFLIVKAATAKAILLRDTTKMTNRYRRFLGLTENTKYASAWIPKKALKFKNGRYYLAKWFTNKIDQEEREATPSSDQTIKQRREEMNRQLLSYT